jgi:hypothetical protein
MAKIFITPLMRTVWHQMIALDKTLLADGTLALPNVATRVAVAIGRHFDNITAETFVSQATLAIELGVSERLIWSAIQALRKRGHLVVRHGGRRSNYYGMPVEKVAAECEIYRRRPAEKVAAECDINLERSQSTPEKVAAGCGLSPSPSEKTISTGSGSFITLLQTRRKEKEAFQGKKVEPPSGSPWQVIKDGMVQSGRVSQAERTSWLDKLSLHATSNGVLTLRGSPFTVRTVAERFQAKIEEAWQGLSGLEADSKATVEFVSAPSAASLKRS